MEGNDDGVGGAGVCKHSAHAQAARPGRAQPCSQRSLQCTVKEEPLAAVGPSCPHGRLCPSADADRCAGLNLVYVGSDSKNPERFLPELVRMCAAAIRSPRCGDSPQQWSFVLLTGRALFLLHTCCWEHPVHALVVHVGVSRGISGSLDVCP